MVYEYTWRDWLQEFFDRTFFIVVGEGLIWFTLYLIFFPLFPPAGFALLMVAFFFPLIVWVLRKWEMFALAYPNWSVLKTMISSFLIIIFGQLILTPVFIFVVIDLLGGGK